MIKLSDAIGTEREIIGNKAYVLSHLLSLGFPVPDGFTGSSFGGTACRTVPGGRLSFQAGLGRPMTSPALPSQFEDTDIPQALTNDFRCVVHQGNNA